MNVDISVPGSFHTPMLARYLLTQNSLGKIYTTQKRYAEEYDEIPRKNVEVVRHPSVVEYLIHRIPYSTAISRWNDPATMWEYKLLDSYVSKKLSPVNNGVFLGFAGCSLKSLRKANEIGLTTVVERSSSHIRTQKQILDKEYQKYELGNSPISERHIKREESEYEIADYIVTPSRFSQQSFLNQGFNKSKVRCVPFGVNPPEIQQNPDDIVRFIYSGNITLRKGVQYLLSAWDSLELPNAELVLTSDIDKSARPMVQKYKKNDDVRFLGWVDSLYEWFGKSSTLVFPTLEEGSARVVYEAMASELPIITTYNSGWVGEDGKHGIEVPIRDVESLADAIQYMYDNPAERKQMGISARKCIQDDYTERDYGERIFSEYQMMVDDC